jgi:hypothetical protein
MSLIHDALKSMDAPQQDPKLVLARAPATAPRRRPAWLDAVLAFVIVVGAGVVGWLTWQSLVKPRADLSPVAAAPVNTVVQPVASPSVASPAASVSPSQAESVAQTPAAATTVADAPAAPVASPTSIVAPVNVAMQSAASVAPSVPTASAMPKVSIAAVAIEPAATSATRASVAQVMPRPASQRQTRSGVPSVPAEPAPVAAPVVDETPVELVFARYVTAMKEGRDADAERALGTLKERLPAGSIGLLRAQAWYDLRAGRDAAAADGYRAIIERMPGDEEAAINLASIQARQQKPEEARATLDAAVRLQPDSVALRAALAQFTPSAR